MSTNTIDLSWFCGYASHFAVDRPWVLDGWEYATDKCVIVRTRTSKPNTPTPLPWQPKLLNPLSLPWPSDSPQDQRGWVAWPSMPFSLFRAADHGVCLTCDSNGLVDGETCCDCGCTQIEAFAELQGVRVALRYVRAFSELISTPVEYCLTGGVTDAIAIRWIGGAALLMPMIPLFSSQLRPLTDAETERVTSQPLKRRAEGGS